MTLDLTKTYRKRRVPIMEVKLLAYVDGYYYGIKRNCQSVHSKWIGCGPYSEGDLEETKPKHTKTYWLVHYENGASACCFVKPNLAIRPLQALAVTGPHQITFEEGQDDRSK